MPLERGHIGQGEFNPVSLRHLALSEAILVDSSCHYDPSNVRRLNPHVHFHCAGGDGVFEAVAGEDLLMRFHETPPLSSEQLTDIQCLACDISY